MSAAAQENWGWNVSALFYERTYGPLAHQLDEDVFRYLGARVQQGVVVDAGCGPGVVVRKFIERGADKVFAVDVSSAMLKQVPAHPRVEPVLGSVSPQLLVDLAFRSTPVGFDILLFKRSLYQSRTAARELLETAFSLLRPGGRIVVVHPEGDWKRYAFGAPGRLRSHTPYHLFNRAVSLGAVWVGAEEYALYTREQLFSLLESVGGADAVESIPSQQGAFNLFALRRD
jgi:SAM-dependent methyltransferase